MAKICGFPLFVVLSLAILNPSQSEEQQAKTRQKRHWIIPPHKLRENVNYMHLDYIAKIRSDEETSTSIRYSLTGAGADRPPINLFTVGPQNGWVKINGVLDREKIPVYHLQGEARFLNGSRAEQNIDLRIEVVDENDCPPVFNLTIGAVHELSAAETYVMTVTATDADQEGTRNSKISYSITEQSHDQMFKIKKDGQIYVSRSTLDRERNDKYTLIVKGTDLDGDLKGNTGTGTVIIHILDVNDNIPTLDKDIYEGSVEENTKFVEVVRIQAIDRDLIHTDNWLAVFTIISGNEANYFSITTDNKTNEGILIINKELDYEELKEVNLVVSVSNKAAYHHSVVVTEGRTYTIRVSVKNQPEGPRFKPAVKVITMSEESSTIILNKVITNYAAIDSDTLLIATNVRYAKGRDVDNWLIIDERTADIRLNKKPDYESKFLINGTYYAEIICITNEVPSKTSTGTIAIQVKDFNDHCPVLIHQSQTLCYEEHALYVSAVDKDQFPNAVPFGFKVDTQNTKESWSVEHLSDTTAIFRSQKTLWPGVYQLFVDVWDQQGKICGGQELRVEVCTCDATKVCLPKKNVSIFGASGVLLMLLGLLLLLLVPLLLLFCLCGAAGAAADFKTIPFDTKAHLITYNTEGQGEDKGMALLQISKDLDKNKRTSVDSSRWAQKKAEGKGGAHWSTFYQYDQHDAYHHLKHQTDGEFMNAQRKDEYSRFQDFSAFDGLALSDAFLGNYYSQKASHVAKKHDMEDNLRVYDYEGRESRRGSFEDICSLLHEDDSLAFLDDLDLKFKTLAEICSGSTMEREISTTIPVTSKPVQTSSHKDTNVQETISLLQSQEREQSSATVLAAGAQQSASMSSAGMFVQEKVVVPNTTLLVQQPALYYAPATPVYVVEPQPTLLMRPGPVLGLQEKLLVEEQRGANAAQRGAAKCEMQHYQNVVLVPSKPTKASVQAQSSVSGAVKIVSTEITQSAEAHGVRRSVHSAKRVTPGEAREREVGFLDMRAPQSL